MGSRSLNGLNGSQSSGLSLIKPYNLADLPDVPTARKNLGLVGSLDINTSPYISITSPFNGTANQTLQ